MFNNKCDLKKQTSKKKQKQKQKQKKRKKNPRLSKYGYNLTVNVRKCKPNELHEKKIRVQLGT